MNQAILFNDDVHYSSQKKALQFSAMVAGSTVLCIINMECFTEIQATSPLEYFNKFKKLLIESQIQFYENPFLVRGLDYYNNSIFEYTLKDNDKYAVLAGGSYDNLVKDLGGPSLAGIGWAAGVERLIDLIEFRKKIIENIVILPMDEDLICHAYKAREVLFNKKIISEVYFVNNLKKSLKYANKTQASYAIIIGKDEIKKSLYSIKNLVTGKQELIDQNKLLEYVENA
jgi:histidyl-tRNA synthetase